MELALSVIVVVQETRRHWTYHRQRYVGSNYLVSREKE